MTRRHPRSRRRRVVDIKAPFSVGSHGGGRILDGSSTGDVIGRMVVFGFPMHSMRDPEAASLMKTACEYVNAPPTLPVMP